MNVSSDKEWFDLVGEIIEHCGVSGEHAELLTAVRAWILSCWTPSERARLAAQGDGAASEAVGFIRGEDGDLEWMAFTHPDGTSYDCDMGDRARWDGESPYERMVWDLLHVQTFGDWRDHIPGAPASLALENKRLCEEIEKYQRSLHEAVSGRDRFKAGLERVFKSTLGTWREIARLTLEGDKP